RWFGPSFPRLGHYGQGGGGEDGGRKTQDTCKTSDGHNPLPAGFWRCKPGRWSRLGDLLAPQPLRRNVRALAHRLELQPYHRLDHPSTLGERAEPAVGRGDDALAVADHRHRLIMRKRHGSVGREAPQHGAGTERYPTRFLVRREYMS